MREREREKRKAENFISTCSHAHDAVYMKESLFFLNGKSKYKIQNTNQWSMDQEHPVYNKN